MYGSGRATGKSAKNASAQPVDMQCLERNFFFLEQQIFRPPANIRAAAVFRPPANIRAAANIRPPAEKKLF